MTTYLFQIQDDTDEAEMMGGACMLAIVEKDHFEETGALASEHILDDMIAATGNTLLADHLDEVAESMFVSDLDPEALRELLSTGDGFEEAELFEDA